MQLTGPTSIWMVVGRGYSLGQRADNVYTSNDEGQTWNARELASSHCSNGSGLRDCWTLDGQVAWAVTTDLSMYTVPPSELLKPTTGIAGFATVKVPVGAGEDLRFVRGFSAAVALAAVMASPGATTWPFLRTTNGGQSWLPVAQPPALTPGDELRKGVLLGNQLWITTKLGNVLYTFDQGQTWQSSASGLGANLRNVVFRDSQHGLAYGADQLRRTTDGGQTWTTFAYTGPARTSSITAVPGALASYLSVADNGTASSTDDGVTWVNLESTSAHSIVTASSPTRAWTTMDAPYFSLSGTLARYVGAALPTRASTENGTFVYPNPTAGSVHLPAAGTYQRAIVYDMLGKQRLTTTLQRAGTSELPLAELGAGVYEVVLIGINTRQTTRILVLP